MVTCFSRNAALAALAAVAVVLIAAGCTGDGSDGRTDGDAATPTAAAGNETPTGDDAGGAPTTTGGSFINAVITYVTETGLDGQEYEVANPINCNAFADPEANATSIDSEKGKVCVNFAGSEFTEADGVVELLVVGEEDTWEITMVLKDFSWIVAGAKRGVE